MPATMDEIYFGQGGLLRSGFGRQILGSAPSSPIVGFGSSYRTTHKKLYASAEHDRALLKSSGGNQSQGAIYSVAPSFGKQALSSKESSPSYSVGSEKRKGLATLNHVPGPGNYKKPDSMAKQVESSRSNAWKPVFGFSTRDIQEKVYQDAESEKTYYGRLSPGPCMYNSKGSMGQQVLSNKVSAQRTGLGYGKRFQYDFVKRAKEQPGAGEYNHGSACGKQNLSLKKSLPLYSFGSSDRDQAKKVYLSRDHEKSAKGNDSPGPLTATQQSAAGKQVLSKKKTNPRCAFSTATRFGKNYYSTSDSPGPAAYAV